jgi:hypothetical protein
MTVLTSAKRFLNNVLFKFGHELRRISPEAGSAGEKFSWANEDEIIASLLNKLPVRNKFAVDIGAGDGEYMSNSYKLFKAGWQGVAVEWNGKQFCKLAFSYSGLSDVTLVRGRVTPDNVLQLLAACDAPKDFSYLGLDIDSYDHFVLEKILSAHRPSLICTEINEKIPPPLRFTVKFQNDGSWGNDHFYGQSLSMLEVLAARHNYDLVNLEYNNAFLIPREINPDPAINAADAWRKGYFERPDRAQRFPWNAEFESIYAKSSAESKAYFREKFQRFEGQYILE